MEIHVQTLAKEIGDYGCLALCYSAIVESLNPEWKNASDEVKALKLLVDVIDGRISGKLDKECYVKSASDFMSFINPNYKYKVEKVDLDGTVNSIRGKIAAVRYDYNGHSHFCLYAGDCIIFDSLDKSNCRTYGKPMSARIVTIEEK